MAVSAVKTETPPAEAAPKPAGKKGLLKIILLLVLVGGAGGGYWYWSQRAHAPAQESKEAAAKPPVFLPLETFTVNLQLVDNPQFLQTSITLSVADNAVVEEIKLQMPVVRDRILLLMSSRKAAELLTVEGKRRLGDEIVATVNAVLAGKTLKSAAKTADAKSADAKGADAEDEAKDAKDVKTADTEDAKEARAAAEEEKAAAAAARPVQAVLFTSFIIQ